MKRLKIMKNREIRLFREATLLKGKEGGYMSP